MNIFLLPKTLIDEIEKMINSFWWGNGGAAQRALGGCLGIIYSFKRVMDEWVLRP